MNSRWFGRAIGTALSALTLLAGGSARAGEEVDLTLVIAVDISYSMDPEEQELQRSGFVEAFRSPLVHEAISRGALGRIAVTYAEWAASWDQKVVVPWTLIDGAPAALRFAERLAAEPTRRGPRTSISGAIDLGARLTGESGLEAQRKVIDISGDGPNNQGRPAVTARNDAIAQGLVINGLPIMLKEAIGWWDMAQLDAYYRDCVIGGQGAFMVPVRERDQFKQAIKTKIILEIAGIAPPTALVQPAQGATDCLAAETRRDRYGP